MLKIQLILLMIMFLSACSSFDKKETSTSLNPFQIPLNQSAINDQQAFINNLYQIRTWMPYRKIGISPIKFSQQSRTPVNHAQTKILGPSYEDAVHSLAAKLWMIEHAEHTIDLTYYIFEYDQIGNAILGALCNAVKRGVDVRIMVDSIGSLSLHHNGIRALEDCAKDAGYMFDANGKVTTHKARVQAVVINALTSIWSWSNRRSHDKLIIKDGAFPAKSMVMTGGRNISLDYYGINKNGSKDPDTYLDMEIILKTAGSDTGNYPGVGDVSSIYYTLLFLHKGNKRIYSSSENNSAPWELEHYVSKRKKAQAALEFIKNIPDVAKSYDKMDIFLNQGFHYSDVRLAHELGNLTNDNVITDVVQNKSKNNNSIAMLIFNRMEQAKKKESIKTNFRIVSPYLFIGKFKDKSGEIIHDGAREILSSLEKHPELTFEIITNSVITSDSFFTQSVIDMDTAPRLLLSPEMQKIWIDDQQESEFSRSFIASREWQQFINHPRLKIYQTGMLDSVLIGGTQEYGKLHAKFFFDDESGFVGTSNFDYRSRLYNNEMGFYYQDPQLSQDLNKQFEKLKAISYRWGTDEWLEMRKKLINAGGFKGYTTNYQRGIYNFLNKTGLLWLF